MKSPKLSKGGFAWMVGFGLFVVAFGFYELDPVTILLGFGTLISAVVMRRQTKIAEVTKLCQFCKSALNEGATVCAKCGREQEAKERVA